MEVHGFIAQPVSRTPPLPPHSGTITWHLQPVDGLDPTANVYIDGSALLAQYGPVVARFAFAIIALDANDQLVAVATGVPPVHVVSSGAAELWAFRQVVHSWPGYK